MRGHSFICGKKTLRRFRETCKPGHFTLHIWGMAGADWAITTHQRAAHAAELTFGFSSDIVAVFCVRVFFSGVCSALVLFLSLPPSVLSSPPLTGARALDHCCERAVGSHRTTWLLNRGSAHRARFAITRTEQYCKGYTVKTSDCLLDRKYRLYVFPYHLFFSFIFMEKEINIPCIKPKSLYCPLLAGCN